MAVVTHVFTEGMDGHNHAELTVRLVCYLSQEFQQAFVGYLAQLLEKPAVIPEIDAQHYGQAEDILAVWERVRH